MGQRLCSDRLQGKQEQRVFVPLPINQILINYLSSMCVCVYSDNIKTDVQSELEFISLVEDAYS